MKHIGEIKDGELVFDKDYIIESLRQQLVKANAKVAKVAELEEWKKSAITVFDGIDLQKIGVELDLTVGDSIGPAILPAIVRFKSQIAYLTARLEAQEASEPVAWYIFEKDMATTDHEWANENSDMVEPLYTTPQPNPTVQAAVSAAYRKAADVAEDCWDENGAYCAAGRILALPHDDSALREICLRVAEQAQHRDNYAERVAIVDRVLGERK